MLGACICRHCASPSGSSPASHVRLVSDSIALLTALLGPVSCQGEINGVAAVWAHALQVLMPGMASNPDVAARCTNQRRSSMTKQSAPSALLPPLPGAWVPGPLCVAWPGACVPPSTWACRPGLSCCVKITTRPSRFTAMCCSAQGTCPSRTLRRPFLIHVLKAWRQLSMLLTSRAKP